LVTAILLMMTAVTLVGGGTPVTRWIAGATGAAALLSSWCFVRHARARGEAAIIPLWMLRRRSFAIVNAHNVCLGAAALGLGALVPLYAFTRFDLSPTAAGTVLSVRAVGIIAVAGIAALMIRRTGYRPLIIGGSLILAAGMLLMCFVPDGVTETTWLAAAAGISGVGMGLALPASNVAALSLAPGRVAALTGLRAMFRQLGGIAAISVTSTVAAAHARPGVAIAFAFAVLAVVLVLATPLAALIPEEGDRS
jgi:MFS family permease